MAEVSIPKSGIYGILHIASGRIYVGSAIDIARRWRAHRSSLRGGQHHSTRLLQAWAEYGEAAFTFVILETVSDLENLFARESHWIDAHQSHLIESGFNLTLRGGSAVGVRRSDETRKRMSLSQKGRVITAEAREKIRLAKTGRKMSADTIARSAAAHVGLKRSPETRAKQRAAKLGKKASPETRAKMSQMRRGKPQHRTGPSWFKGRKRSATFRKKVSEGIKAHWEIRRKRLRSTAAAASAAPLAAA